MNSIPRNYPDLPQLSGPFLYSTRPEPTAQSTLSLPDPAESHLQCEGD